MEKAEEKIRYDSDYVVALEKENRQLRAEKQQLETDIAYKTREDQTGVQLLNE